MEHNSEGLSLDALTSLEELAAAGRADTATPIAAHRAEICIRQYSDAPECDVIIMFRGRELSLRCRDYDEAVKWARIECKSYKAAQGFTVERKGALMAKLAAAAWRARASQTWPVAPSASSMEASKPV
ncbi:hypothetical protein JQ628_18390 [Bradyrhizobium lablabi]|uniref:hypothetical protein n=1 Tax=Bradyrhizobium lablabi TaxID=722472 RepID=UPI001BA97809|nr:hypothetical protein [Bradyrhizobium lablabi]MBR1123499.1 hypothetical protein [Bradyrhizobium lablabi]